MVFVSVEVHPLEEVTVSVAVSAVSVPLYKTTGFCRLEESPLEKFHFHATTFRESVLLSVNLI